VIVVDDGSTDDTEAFMTDFSSKHPQVRYLKHDTPKGANAARNYDIREARGYFVTGLDDDDEFLPERIEKLVGAYDGEYAYVFGHIEIVSVKRKNRIVGAEKSVISLDDLLYSNIVGNQVLASKEMFVQAGLFDEELPSAQDYDMWIRMLTVKKSARAVLEPLYIAYEHDNGQITTSCKRFKGYFACYKKHKHMMTIEHRKKTFIWLRFVKGKKNRSIKIINTLYPKYLWPRLYLGYIKRKLF
jgi:glycosyltransferase involved in cell wall biosynthesis